jgi:uncharacterized protein (DUF305 family)
MKNTIFAAVLTTAAVAFAACNQTASNGNSAVNRGGMQNGSLNSMNHNSMPMNSNMSGMNHGSMQSSPNAASQPYDLQFIDTMTNHHQGAIEMAEMALKKSNNAELRTFAQKIIDDQKKEITQMKDWREKWYAGKPESVNMQMPGMMDSMKMMAGDEMTKMETVSGKDFDVHFLDMMTPHHAGAVTMAKEALTRAEHPEIKTLAQAIIREQEKEIGQMADWKARWSK